MIKPESVLTPRPEGLYCPPGDFFVDPVRPVERAVELPLVISDHADWDELTSTIAEIRPEQLWITHGREEALARWAELNGLKARALALVGYEEEEGE